MSKRWLHLPESLKILCWAPIFSDTLAPCASAGRHLADINLLDDALTRAVRPARLLHWTLNSHLWTDDNQRMATLLLIAEIVLVYEYFQSLFR